MTDIFQLTIILVASLIAAVVARKLNIPAVVGQMLVGVLLAPSALGWISGGHTIEVMAEIGVILLMFLAGLESNFSVLKKNFAPSFLVAILGVLVPLGAFGLAAHLLGYGWSNAIFYGIVFAATSVSITVEVLQEFGHLKTRAGNIILGAAVVDDILAVVILSIFSSLQGGKGNLLWQFFLEFLFLLLLVAVHWLVPRFWRWVEPLPIYAKNTTVALLLCLVLSLLASAVGMSAVLGSFFAGLAISQTEVSEKIKEFVSAIGYVVFIPVFFVSLAVSVKFDSIVERPLIVVLFIVLAILTKMLPAYLAGRLNKLSKSESLLIGTGMVSRGEMALIVAQIGLADQIINSDVYSELVIVIVVTTLFAPFLIKWSLRERREN